MRRTLTLYDAVITTALTGFAAAGQGLPADVDVLSCRAALTYGSGGTTAKAWVQTTFDRGRTWVDIMCFAFALTTATKISVRGVTVAAPAYQPTDATLADDLIKDGLIGEVVRVKVTTTGTYAGNTRLVVTAVAM